jgi:D-alanyl-D-alanine carboxypeptidase
MYMDEVLAVPSATLQNPLHPTPPELARAMVLLKVMHYDFADTIKQGHLVVHSLVLEDVRNFFKEAYALHFPIHSVIPIHQFNWDDEVSCLANNSSGHNLRHFEDGRMSKHGIGCAFDINPRQNPCFVLHEDTLKLKRVIPWDGTYLRHTAGTLHKEHPLVKYMVARGWAWGGNWTFPKDYQHFQIVPPALAHYVQ